MLTEAAARWTTFVALFFRDLGFSEVRADNRLNTDCYLEERLWGLFPNSNGWMNHHKLTPCLFALEWWNVNRLLRAKVSLVAQIISQVCV